LDWCKVKGYRDGENPARWAGHLDHLLPARTKVKKVEHHAALDYHQIGAFMQDLRDVHGVAARALEFLVLTCSRTDEVRGARWSEIDLDARLWVIPATRMKGRREHRVPLSTAAIKLLRALDRSSDLVFPSGRTGGLIGNAAMLKLSGEMNRGDITPHGFRSSFKDWASEETEFANEVSELALAHAVGNKVEQAYRRKDQFEKRRALAEAWSDFVGTV
jgi:integrase